MWKISHPKSRLKRWAQTEPGESITSYIQKHDMSVMWSYIFSPEQIDMFESLTTEMVESMHDQLIKMRIYRNKKWWKLKTE